jgi:hypothetical protein
MILKVVLDGGDQGSGEAVRLQHLFGEASVANGHGTIQLAWSGKKVPDAKVALDRMDRCYISVSLEDLDLSDEPSSS